MIAALARAFADLEKDTEVRAIIITGGDGRMFSAGADVNFLIKSPPEAVEKLTADGTELMDRIESFPKPVIAAVNGLALGGGNELAMACDVRIAAESARFGLPEINLGLIPGWGGIQRLSRILGKGRAAEAVMTGAMIKAQDALAMGLVNKLVPDADLMTEARAMAEKFASMAPLAMATIKRRLVDGLGEPLGKAVREDVKAFAVNFRTKDAREGITAFLEKRPPQFKGE
jgi:enoyl-CoA hydratase/carnithine racemase